MLIIRLLLCFRQLGVHSIQFFPHSIETLERMSARLFSVSCISFVGGILYIELFPKLNII